MKFLFNGPPEQGGGLVFSLLAQPVKKLQTKCEDGSPQVHLLHINMEDEKAITYAWSGSQEEFESLFTEHEEENNSKA